MANQTVNIAVTDKNNANSNYSVVTDDVGIGTLELDKSAGEYIITISYDGNDKYSTSNSTQKLTIKEEVIESTVLEHSIKTSNTHTIMGEDGYYYVVDDEGNIMENLGPSQKYYPNDPNSVNYPDAEPANRYIDKSK